ncbi:unnamed protein product [Spodoptera littoralis]|uniref:Uncharacterized protein n=1 Tax=Spodoptera littoralis TaxID=7109 RepID=A0A9P0IJU1_SPOLI|nr:unnamed protein product [Spodoptera littoralis]CAH1647319.1 unnamed protein product [Spodoptera littoralis]
MNLKLYGIRLCSIGLSWAPLPHSPTRRPASDARDAMPRNWTRKTTKASCIKKIKEVKKNLFKSSSSEESADEQVPYVESDLENIEIPLNIQQNFQNEREQSVCAICLEEGKPREIWYRCRLCAGWAHEACTGCDDPSRYRCDFCI